jgi:predicted protein tyrosine phosphatase
MSTPVKIPMKIPVKIPVKIKVGGLHTITMDLPSFRPTHLIGILDPQTPPPAAYAHGEAERESLLLRFLDRESPLEEAPQAHHVETIWTFIGQAHEAAAREPARLFVHCHAGASRSTATAYLALIHRHGVAGAESAFAELLQVTNKPWPNRRIVALADEMLAAGGRLLAPLDAYREANPQRLSAYLRLHLRRAAKDETYAEALGTANWRHFRR